MIIDYDKPLDEKGEKYETYFLNLVDSRDLLDIVDAKDIPDEPEVIYVTPEPTAVPTQSPSAENAPQKPDSSKTILGLAAIAVLAGGGALWYFKQKKGKKRSLVQEYDFDSDEEEETNDRDE